MKEQTAVQFLFSELERCQYFIGNDIFHAYKVALEIEKEQIYDAFVEGWGEENNMEEGEIMNGEDSPYYKYYIDTYKQY